MLTGNYTVPQILSKPNNKWGFKTPQKRRLGGKPLALSGLYNIFSNVFYTGLILHKGQIYPGKHDPMITLEEFDRVQEVLGRKGKPRPKKHQFAFTGVIRCGECGCLHTAELKKKLIKKTGKVREYTYYHCTRKKRKLNCSQRKVLEVTELEKQIEREIDKYTILPEFRDWALEVLSSQNDVEIKDRTKVYEMVHKNLTETQEELDELTRMRYGKLIDDDSFLKEKAELQKKIAQLRSNLREMESRADKWLELTEKTFNFATYAHVWFLNGTLGEKREILRGLCSNPIIKDQKITIEAKKWFIPIGTRYKPLEEKYLRLELNKTPLNSVKREALASLITDWHGWRESNPR